MVMYRKPLASEGIELAAAIRRSPRVINKPTEVELNDYLSAVNDVSGEKDDKGVCETMCNCTETGPEEESYSEYPRADVAGNRFNEPSEIPFEQGIKYPTPRGGFNETPMLRKAARTNRLEYMDERRQEDLDNVHRRINSIEEQQSMFNTDLAARIRAIETILGIDD